ncbi:LacI family DNA-binding transcriptional regulator [Mycoplasma sp. 1018B]|uniref:LacI family DNA-binding transcriptional regulator n=1 Tax=Mycoplasma sp. 1018B TaxID=2967302 RepID=UPI00211BEA66|nr:LacI family DNA-binding transcriptional regulator [Mycoplasma sp. 1018B]UUM19334.1 LacI family DNA-binding transcriptional regulator [Mycoplasma sp. 1018B]
MKKINYKILAEKANVSISSVSRYFNSGYISKKTELKVEQALKDLNYDFYLNSQTNNKTPLSDTIVVFLSNEYNNNFYDILQGINYSAQAKDKKVLSYFVDKNRDKAKKLFIKIRSQLPFAIIFFNQNLIINKLFNEIFTKKQNENVKILLFNTLSDHFSSLQVDYIKPFQQLVVLLSPNLNASTNKIIYLDDINDNERLRFYKKEGFSQGMLSIEKEPFFLEFNPKSKESIIKISNSILLNDYKYIICSSHEAYLALAHIRELKNFYLTDIGPANYFDFFPRYNYKILEDWFHIGIQMERMLTTKVPTETKIFVLKHSGKIIKNDEI